MVLSIFNPFDKIFRGLIYPKELRIHFGSVLEFIPFFFISLKLCENKFYKNPQQKCMSCLEFGHMLNSQGHFYSL